MGKMIQRMLNILMVDDHPMIIEGYRNAILNANIIPSSLMNITTAHNCEDAYNAIIQSSEKTHFHIAFLDISLAPYVQKNMKSGEDLAKLIKNILPDCKIIMLTMHTEAVRLSNIVRTIKPQGLLIKSDITLDKFQQVLKKIMNGEVYLSSTASKSVKQALSSELNLDHDNLQILSCIAKGVKTKNLPNYIALSLSAIEKRKTLLKIQLGIEKGTDKDLINEAKKLGVI